MTKQPYFRRKCLAAALAAFGMTGMAQAVDEVELNNAIPSAQALTIYGGSVTVKGQLEAGVDEDFFSFEAKEGDRVTLNIDGAAAGNPLDLDTMLTLFGPSPTYEPLMVNDDAMPDAGSIDAKDARIDAWPILVSGRYYVAVSAYFGSGTYNLTISGVTSPSAPPPPPPPPASPLDVKIDIKPGNVAAAPVQANSKRTIPVALLSRDSFSALNVDVKSLRFGAKGNEQSLVKCGKGEDVNRDGLPDMLCHFDNQLANFSAGDLEGVLKGVTVDGKPIEGRGWLKVMPTKNKKK